MKIALNPLQLLPLLSLAFLCAAPPVFAQQTPLSLTMTADPINWEGGADGRGSRLNEGDTILIQAPMVATDLTKMSLYQRVQNLPCRSITNNSDKDNYFVPWNTPPEWNSFLTATNQNNVSIGPCCLPLPQTVTDPQGNSCPEQVVPQGPRIAGLPGARFGEDPIGYAVPPDISLPITINDQFENITVTFQCQPNGTWLQITTSTQGSCVPSNGSCASGSSAITTIPSDTSTLCSPNSTFGVFTQGSASSPGPWAWTCLGTAGGASATCSATGSFDGQCANTTGMTVLPTDLTTLCASGSTFGVFTQGSATSAGPWAWTCQGTPGTTPTPCSSQGAVGACAANISGLTSMPADTTTLCASGTFGGFTNPGGAAGPAPWSWTCQGAPNQPAAVCTTGSNCGPAQGIDLRGPPDGLPTWTPDLCVNGATASVINGYDEDIKNVPPPQGNLYHWTCTSPTLKSACWAYEPDGLCGKIETTSATAAPISPQDSMCSAGTLTAWMTYGPLTTAGPQPGFVDFDALYFGYAGSIGWQWGCVGHQDSFSCIQFNKNASSSGP